MSFIFLLPCPVSSLGIDYGSKMKKRCRMCKGKLCFRCKKCYGCEGCKCGLGGSLKVKEKNK